MSAWVAGYGEFGRGNGAPVLYELLFVRSNTLRCPIRMEIHVTLSEL
jgi:hypothetical protein